MKKVLLFSTIILSLLSCGKNEELQKQLEAEKAKTANAEKEMIEQRAQLESAAKQKTIDSLNEINARNQKQEQTEANIAEAKSQMKISTHYQGRSVEIKIRNTSDNTIVSNMTFRITFYNGNGSVKKSINVIKNDKIYPGGELNFHEDTDETGKYNVELVKAKYSSK
eukprot:TRINITY_DN6014_c0_g1_i1.p3 TRINITY_DN6014_c0_g1~~TRINITY_DN6014_c0_g1_i1.p3  ORF type:complete len:167 (-),score=23.17 TRINITY_DN6014_c0_g1_i1:1427-1927(-)